MTIHERKNTIRQEMKLQRSQLSDEEQYHCAQELCRHWYAEPRLRHALCIGAYHPIQSEISPLPLLRMLQHAKVPLALPVVTDKHAPLTFYPYTLGDPLYVGKHGISEPARSQPLLPDMLIVPLLAYDEQGTRLGYGGGYYDRTLQHLTQQGITPLCIGIAYSFQHHDDLPREAHDMTLDAVITPDGITWFTE